jgi:hypothetical protein
VMLIAVGIARGARTDDGRRAVRYGAAALAAFAITIASVRLIVGSAPLFKPFNLSPGFDYVRYNLRTGLTWEYLFRTLNIVPFVALAGLARWPRELKAFAIAIVPLWALVHLLASILAETRLLLVPYAVVFVPGALFALRGSASLRDRLGHAGQEQEAG